ncbi:MAG TPA: TlpA disulfide reductase family protein, partial [Acidimicrobiales bacterium]|nr:TlpA disulfide reductase family protein [Acidimicrobiales bacterium]
RADEDGRDDPEVPPSGSSDPSGSHVPSASAPTAPDHRTPTWRSGRGLGSLGVGLAVAGLLAFLLFGVIGTGPGSRAGQVVPVGSIAPEFTLPSLQAGPPVNLDALGPDRHRPVVLNFFASWCIPCQEETPLLAGVARHEQRVHAPVQFVGVDVGDVQSKALAFVEQAGVDYPVGVDADLTVTSGRYGLDGEPQTFFLDSSGRVVVHKIGALDRSELESDLRQLTA